MIRLTFLICCLSLLTACAVEHAAEVAVVSEASYPELVSTKIVPTHDRGAQAVFVAERPLLANARGLVLQSALPTLTPSLRAALEVQRDLLKRQDAKKVYEINGRELTRRDFMRVIDDLLSGRYMVDPLAAVPVAAGGEVHFTGYYSPEVQLSTTRSRKFRYPVYEYPEAYEGRLPSRREIEREGALDGKARVIGYAAHVLDVYTLQLQGSGFVRFEDGSRHYLAYNGTNRYPYQSIEQALSRRDSSISDLSLRNLKRWVSENPQLRDSITTFNPNYGFFKLSDGKARGAAGVALKPMVSVAADPAHYPLGSVLLANVPVVNRPGKFQTRILLVQDTGGAIKGAHHLDLYTGVGDRALDVAERTGSFGEVYLLSPR